MVVHSVVVEMLVGLRILTGLEDVALLGHVEDVLLLDLLSLTLTMLVASHSLDLYPVLDVVPHELQVLLTNVHISR